MTSQAAGTQVHVRKKQCAYFAHTIDFETLLLYIYYIHNYNLLHGVIQVCVGVCKMFHSVNVLFMQC